MLFFRYSKIETPHLLDPILKDMVIDSAVDIIKQGQIAVWSRGASHWKA